MSFSRKEALQCLFDRPTEMVFMPKGKDNSVVFDVPASYVIKEYRGFSKDIVKKLTRKNPYKTIPVNNITLPDLTECSALGLKDSFSLFVPKHVDIASKLIAIFMGAKSVQDLISIAAYSRDRVNPYLFNYSLSVALLHREDTKEVQIPNYAQVFPAKFAPSEALGAARATAAVVPLNGRIPIDLLSESISSPNNPESRLAYFREDIGINIHHWHWHLVYPTRGATPSLYNKDRRGELFYYMHQQVLARYNTERLANGLQKVVNYDNLRSVIAEGYFPKLDMLVASRAWPPRQANTPLSSLNRPNDGLNISITSVETSMSRVRQAIIDRFIVNTSGSQVSLTGTNGIDILGNLIEATALSLNRTRYGNIHNTGHVLIAYCHDPNGNFNETAAVMSDTATAMRDPIFYRWHNYINSLFVLHKDLLPRYTVTQLSFTNVSVTDVQVVIPTKTPNELLTHWQQSDIDISRGLDFAPRSAVSFRYTHLQHESFNYVVTVNNATQLQRLGTMRIFMALKNNASGAAMTFNEQRSMMIELDKFRVTLTPGVNTITRSSMDSSVTLPYERTFRNLDDNRPTTNPSLYAFNFCGCGWPQHMLIPKGNAAGMQFDLFAMVSDYTRDEIVQDTVGICNDAASYCGIQDRRYPDRQSMGFPFDRVGRDGVNTLTDFLTPNMKIRTITVKALDTTVIRPEEPAPVAQAP